MPEIAERPSIDADSPTQNHPTPWWEFYDSNNVIGFDCEMVALFPKYSKTGSFFQAAATVDLVTLNGESFYSTKVRHATGTFQTKGQVKEVTGFQENSFDDPSFPPLETVREIMKQKLQGKLIITVGGRGDFESLGLDIANYDCFDLQQHFFVKKYNEYEMPIREGHSLRSLAKYFLNRSPQEKFHSSFEDALATIQLFEKYKEIKIQDDPNNCDMRFNSMIDYNHIPVIPNPLKRKKKVKK